MLWLAGVTDARADQAADLELILAIDCSYSVDDAEFELQKQGLAEAFRHESVLAAIKTGEHGVIAITVIEWSSSRSQVIAVPWTLVHDAASADALAAQISIMPRLTKEGATSISTMIEVGVALFEQNQIDGARKVIDISADGRNNHGRRIEPMQALARNRGVIINGLVILHEDERLDYYFRKKVIAGAGAFVIKAHDYENYIEAILVKLVREIHEPSVS